MALKMKHVNGLYILVAGLLLMSCSPKEKIVLRDIKNIVFDGSSGLLRAEAVFYNPNKIRMKLRSIDIDIYVSDKKAARIDQEFKTVIPARKEFSVPLEVKLQLKEQGFMDTLFGMLGGKKLDVRYEGSLKLSYHGYPIRVPVRYSEQVQIKL